MRPILKRLHSPDVENLEEYCPQDPNNFSFLLQVMVGPEDEEGEESFDIEVCTPEWLKTRCAREGVVIGRHLIVLEKYDYKKICKFLDSYLYGCAGESWGEVAEKISRIGKWEFEDYKK